LTTIKGTKREDYFFHENWAKIAGDGRNTTPHGVPS